MKFKYNKIASDSFFLLAAEFLMKMKGIIFLPLIISKVGLENYGIFVQVLINPSIIASLCSMSLNTNFLRYTSKFSSDKKSLISKDFYTIFFFILFKILLRQFCKNPIQHITYTSIILGGKCKEISKAQFIEIHGRFFHI